MNSIETKSNKYLLREKILINAMRISQNFTKSTKAERSAYRCNFTLFRWGVIYHFIVVRDYSKLNFVYKGFSKTYKFQVLITIRVRYLKFYSLNFRDAHH